MPMKRAELETLLTVELGSLQPRQLERILDALARIYRAHDGQETLSQLAPRLEP
jgi:hypothetical protein